MRRKNETPRKERQFCVFLTFDTSTERDEVYEFLNTEGRTPASYVKYLLTKEMEQNKRYKIGKSIPSARFGN